MKPAIALAVTTACLAAPLAARAQSDPNGPTALIVSYHAKPADRAKFREIMRHEGVAQFETWKRQGVFEAYQALFTTYAASTEPDMFLILHFAHFADLGHWQHIEETYPGGLPADAQALATPEFSATADIVKENSVAPTTRESQFFVLEYNVLADMPKYTSYVLGYATPQFDEWEKAGVLSSYAVYTNQNPAGAPWSSFILLEYKDLPSLADREVVKNKARADLAASNPTWKKWSDDKTAMRTEKLAIPVRALNAP
jgi:hypothetical protein